MLHAGQTVEERVVATGDLGTALDRVPRDNRARQAVEHGGVSRGGIGIGPAMPPRGGAHDERGIGDPTRDDDICSGRQRCRDRLSAEVGIGGKEVDPLGRLSRVEVGPRFAKVAHARHEVIARDDTDAHRTEAELLDELGESIGAALGIEPARVGHDPDALVTAGAENLLHLSEERARIAGPWTVLHALPGEDEHGELGKPVTGEHVDRATLDHLARCGDAVTKEAAAVGDDHRAIHASASRTATTWWASTD